MAIFGDDKKIQDQEHMPDAMKDALDRIKDSTTVNVGAMTNNGLNCGNIPEPIPFHNQAQCEVIYKNNNNAWIVLGRDRPGPKSSGYGGQGATQAGAIDMVVGKMGATKEGPKSNIYTDPNFAGDAARIYISQKTDIDKNFDLARGNVGLSEARSGIGIKADAVRVIGREGIKLVTGTSSNERTSGGGKRRVTYGIDLIAANDDDTVELEPMVKGTRLVSALKDMNARIDELNGLYSTLVIALIAHGHPPFMVPSPTLAIQGLVQCLIPAYGNKTELMINEMNNLSAFGGNWINSRFNRVN
tara:strand:- start:443 stop:1345 length:903 start_codon:yes stop_codon:yes gene_type:complete